MASSSFKSISNHKWAYDVFVNFGGDNNVKSFVDHLFSDFKRKGIRAFRDDEKLHIGEDRSQQVYRAIEQSRFLVVIFSKNFASSPWRLRELVKIFECKEKENDKYQIHTIFYKVKPEMVLNQIDSCKATFSKHETIEKNEVSLWKGALTMAANLPGWDLEDLAHGYESKFIDMISKHIFNELNDGPLHVGVNLVGVHFRAEQMNLLHFAEASEVHMIGICGVWGIGKTSIAKAVYNRLYVHFEGCSFCEDIKGFVKMHGGMIQLQRQIIEDITKADMKIRSVGEGSSVMKRIMASKQVLVILDEIDQLDQLEALAGAHCWFGPGSLIVITGEDRQLLLGHGVEKIYDVELLNDDEAMELLSLYAFKQKHPKEDFTWLSKQVVQYVKGHPLALKVLGCFLFGKTVHEWESELDRLHRHHIDDMQGLISRYSSKKKQKVV
ncbi:TMV resistance protein N-like isoform X1 [Cynara cardunculus var. scolymus]|uniref:TMV resistance protein N-like isoform X1 n=1 Tax=Cynara cardunculus var. scolymus TaxID=59895 RepID=UPI000D62D79A|nr:TMV resistance protein N-like isoform X1 [Cynara cardunculus var. scolymus]XP_024993594.1 TMV resistance protein N-like isoform X1 [Cynara cardunculus var. scolymus]